MYFHQFLKKLIYLFGYAGSSLLHACFLQLQQAGAILQLWCADFSLWWLLLWSTGSRCVASVFVVHVPRACSLQYLWLMGLELAGFSTCGSWALQASVLVAGRLSSCGTWAQQLQHADSVVAVNRLSCSLAVASSRTRYWTCVSCIGRQILIHCTTREVLNNFR